MKKFAILATMLAFAIAVLLLPAATMATQPYFTRSVATVNLGPIVQGNSATFSVTLDYSGSNGEVLFGVWIPQVNNPISISVTEAGLGTFSLSSTLGSISVTIPGFGVGQPLLDSGVNSTDTRLATFFGGSAVNLTTGLSTTFTVVVTPTNIGTTTGSITFFQTIDATDPTVNFTITVVAPPPPPPPPPPPSISFFHEYTVVGDSASVGLFLKWNTIWLKTGSVVWDLGDGRTVQGQNVRAKLPLGANTIKATAVDERNGEIYTDTQVLTLTASVASPPPLTSPAVIPAEPEYRPSQSSDRAISEKAGGRSEKRKGGYWGKAGKLSTAGVQPSSWGEIKRKTAQQETK